MKTTEDTAINRRSRMENSLHEIDTFTDKAEQMWVDLREDLPAVPFDDIHVRYCCRGQEQEHFFIVMVFKIESRTFEITATCYTDDDMFYFTITRDREVILTNALPYDDFITALRGTFVRDGLDHDSDSSNQL